MMSVEKIPMTKEGNVRLEAELKNLKGVERPNVIKAIAEARAHGDLSENAEYHAARDKQSFIEGRILELEDKLSRAEVIDPTKLAGDKVVFGCTVKIVDVETNEEITYKIVGADESDIKSGRLSYTAPVARALIGKRLGDNVDVKTPGGQATYEIISIDFK